MKLIKHTTSTLSLAALLFAGASFAVGAASLPELPQPNEKAKMLDARSGIVVTLVPELDTVSEVQREKFLRQYDVQVKFICGEGYTFTLAQKQAFIQYVLQEKSRLLALPETPSKPKINEEDIFLYLRADLENYRQVDSWIIEAVETAKIANIAFSSPEAAIEYHQKISDRSQP